MVEPFDTLMQVQQHDTSLDQLRHRIETLPERATLAELDRRRATLQATLAGVQAQVDDLAGRQRALEATIATTAKRRHELEQRMLSGEVSASRDLQAMDHEVQHLSLRQSELEEEDIALLEEEEPLDALLEDHRSASAALAAETERLTEVVRDAEAAIRTDIAAEEAQREASAAALPDELAQRYEKLRARLGGVGAAPLVGDRCGGCHLTLSSVDVERIRRLPPDEIATCPECDRILVH